MYMNEAQITEAFAKWVKHPVLGRASAVLYRFMEIINECTSGGWAECGGAQKAAWKLMNLVESGDGSEEALKRALTPVKQFVTRNNLPTD